MKISGDGAEFSRCSSFVFLSFSLPGTTENVLSSSGMQTNTWTVHVCTMSPVIDEINSLIKSPAVDGYDVDILLGGDYKE